MQRKVGIAAGQRAIDVEIEVGAGGGERRAATGDRRDGDRPGQARDLATDAERERGLRGAAAAAGRDRRGGEANLAGETITQRALAAGADHRRAPRRAQPGNRIGQREVQRRQPRRLTRGRIDQRIERAEMQRPVAPLPVEPHPARDDITEPDALRGEARADLHPRGGQIGMRRIADHDIGQHHMRRADFGNAIGGGQVQRRQRLVNRAVGERNPLDPEHRAGRQRQRHGARQPAGAAGPARGGRNDVGGGVHRHGLG